MIARHEWETTKHLSEDTHGQEKLVNYLQDSIQYRLFQGITSEWSFKERWATFCGVLCQQRAVILQIVGKSGFCSSFYHDHEMDPVLLRTAFLLPKFPPFLIFGVPSMHITYCLFSKIQIEDWVCIHNPEQDQNVQNNQVPQTFYHETRIANKMSSEIGESVCTKCLSANVHLLTALDCQQTSHLFSLLVG